MALWVASLCSVCAWGGGGGQAGPEGVRTEAACQEQRGGSGVVSLHHEGEGGAGQGQGLGTPSLVGGSTRPGNRLLLEPRKVCHFCD